MASGLLLFVVLWLLAGSALAVLSAPSSLNAVTYSKTQINLQWNDPNAGADQETGYVVERAKGAPSGWSDAFTTSANVTSWSNTSLSPGTVYYFRVRAFVMAGGVATYSGYSVTTSAGTQSAGYPDPVVALVASASSDAQIKLTWQNKAANATGYRVYQLAGAEWVVIGITTSSKNYYVVTGLVPQTQYTFRVTAYNGTGESPPSNDGSALTKVPSDAVAPVGTVAINGGAGAAASPNVTLSLIASDAVGVTAYYVAASSAVPVAGAAGWTAVTTTSNLGINVGYALAAGSGSRPVYAWFKDAAGNVSATATASIMLDQTSPANGTLSASASGATQVNLSWSGFSDADSGLDGASYKLVMATGSSPAAACASGTVLYTGSATSYSHTGLAGGTTYNYRICVADVVGNIATGATASATTGVGGGGPNPTGMTINLNAPYTNAVAVILNLGMTDAAGVTGYWVSMAATAPAATATGWIAIAQTTSYNANVAYTLPFTGDGNKTLYVWFKNAAGVVSQMFTDSIVLDRTLPNNGTLTATAGLGQASLSWSGFTDGGSGLGGAAPYKVVFAPQAAPASCAAGTTIYTGSATSFVHTSLTPGILNYYRVCAVDQAGNTSAGATASASVLANANPIAKAGPDQTGAVNTTIYFDSSGSYDPDGTITSYAYTFGDGASINGNFGGVVTHAYAAAGTYTMTLTVTDNQGLASTDTAVVTIKAPVASQGNFASIRQLGGSGIEVGYGVAVDAVGNVVATGTFQNTVNLGGGNLPSAGASDIYIAKYSAAGAHVCSLAIGGAGEEKVSAVAVDASGNIFIAGSFQGSVNFGGTTRTSIGASDAFVAKYSSNCAATAQWVRTFGSSTDDVGYGLVVDPSGDVIMTGYFTSNADFGGGIVLSNGPFADVFMAKYSGASGAYQWAHTLNGISVDTGRAAAVDSAGNVVLTGMFSQTVSDETHPTLLTSSGSADGFLIKYAPSGAFQWARSFGGVGEDVPYGIAIDVGGNIAVVGSFENTISFNGGSLTSLGLSDGFLAKFSPMGTYLWATRFGASGVDIGYAIATDGVGNVVMTGAVQNSGQQDIIVSKYSSVGAPLWTKSYGGSTNDVGYGVALDATGNVFVTGYFQTTIDFGSGPLTSAGFSDAFLLKLTP